MAKKTTSARKNTGNKKSAGGTFKAFWKAFCWTLSTIIFLFGVHCALEKLSPQYKAHFRVGSQKALSALSAGARSVENKLSPEPSVIIQPSAVNSKYDNLAMGVPGGLCDVIVDRAGYALGYSEKYEQPLWVTYHFTREEAKSKKARRSDDFRVDPMIPTGSATPEDYKGSSFDRGHLAPAADMSFSLQAMSESFYMSNMSPQYADFNRGIWKDLEAKVRNYAIYNGDIYVVTGPIFEPDKTVITIGANEVAVPEKYYKVLLDVKSSKPQAIGFVLENRGSKKSLREFAVTVDAVEKLTGLDFFSNLDDTSEARLESQCDFDAWEKVLPPKLRSK